MTLVEVTPSGNQAVYTHLRKAHTPGSESHWGHSPRPGLAPGPMGSTSGDTAPTTVFDLGFIVYPRILEVDVTALNGRLSYTLERPPCPTIRPVASEWHSVTASWSPATPAPSLP